MRIEYKYIVPENKLDALRAALKPFLTPDKFSVHRQVDEYTVRSVYFDTAGFKAYYEKIEGLMERKKLRIRGYNQPVDTDIIFLEIKQKDKNHISKRRAPSHFEHLSELMKTRDFDQYILRKPGQTKPLQDAEVFFFHLFRWRMKPVVLVTYDREAYFCHFDPSLRITFDKKVRGKIYPVLDELYDDDLVITDPGYFILEVKFTRDLPLWMIEIIRSFNLLRTTYSKYCRTVYRHLGPFPDRPNFHHSPDGHKKGLIYVP